ncbi:MAG: lipase maturation factor family protein, partial [Deltaproteobacteria bacterium]|nr:lipase maturation factor family protein [Deltaproteobacteria bacterium]
AVSWFAYLSFVSIGWPFMSFQWDMLLLEASFTAFFFVPWRAWDRLAGHPEPHPVARWALWWLLFRLVFRSAYVKLASGDPTWADMSALSYHYWTQPLPTTLAWYANLLPDGIQKLACAVMFAIEFGAPVLLWVPRAWARRAAAGSIAALMLLIGFTGNYGFFNLLTIVLCLPLLDDRLLRRFVPRRFLVKAGPERESKWSTWPGVAPAIVIALSAALFFTGTLGQRPPRWLSPIYPFSTFNNYGLFAVMTTERPEISIEGTLDGKIWKPYVFRYKPGPLDRAPVWTAPHQPRLDWQMWFAALGDYRRNTWLGNLMTRLLQDEPSVLALIGENPFEDAPPKQIRAVIYRYEPTGRDERDATGQWWPSPLVLQSERHRRPVGEHAVLPRTTGTDDLLIRTDSYRVARSWDRLLGPDVLVADCVICEAKEASDVELVLVLDAGVRNPGRPSPTPLPQEPGAA